MVVVAEYCLFRDLGALSLLYLAKSEDESLNVSGFSCSSMVQLPRW